MPQNRTNVVVGGIEFEYQTDVSVDTSSRIKQHEVLSGDVVIQHLGRKPDTIQVQGVCIEADAIAIDELASGGIVPVASDRWTGDAVLHTAGSTPRWEKDPDEEWLYDFDIKLIEVTDVFPFAGPSGGLRRSDGPGVI